MGQRQASKSQFQHMLSMGTMGMGEETERLMSAGSKDKPPQGAFSDYVFDD